jgi:hypothetical protein
MPKELMHSFDVGRTRATHAGYAVYRLRGKLGLPADLIGKFKSAQKAVDSAEDLGVDYGAFRLLASVGGTEPRERIKRNDLPVSEVLNLSLQKKKQ